MRFLSVCSGIEAASVAWHPIGWKALAFSEIEAFPRAVLAHHYPATPLHGDFTKLRDEPWIVDADVLVGGTPCQAFSVAGLRQSLSDDRGNLTLEFVRLADAVDDLRRARGEQPAIVVWENVPGVLSVKDNAFGCFLAALVGNDAPIVPTGRKWTNAGLVIGPKRAAAWRILDAQYFGVAQRRRRVFVVASARDGFDPATVLFEPESVRRDTPPSRNARQTAPTIPPRSTAGGGLGTDFDCDGGLIPSVAGALDTECGGGKLTHQTINNGHIIGVPVIEQPYAVGNTLTARMHKGINTTLDEGQTPVIAFDILGSLATNGGKETDVHTALRSRAPGASENNTTTVVVEPVAVAFSCKDSGNDAGVEVSPTLRAMGGNQPNGGGQVAVAFDQHYKPSETAQTLVAGGSGGRNEFNHPTVFTAMAVRRLTPRECERLQGFPDDYTLIPVRNKPAADGPRYKALGNSMAVPVMHWIGKRIQQHLEQQQ
jgi:DNA (cytosine-5)-methyltransferase 1